MMKSFIAKESKRIDKLLADYFPSYSRSYFQWLIEKGGVRYKGRKIKKREIPRIGDQIDIDFISPSKIQLIPEKFPLTVLYEDDYIICINKPAGMVTHPAPGHPRGTVVNALLYHCCSLPSQDLRPGIVHRLDRETSGVLIAAKTTQSHKKLIEAFSKREIWKEYLAITVGKLKNQTIEIPIGRHPIERKRMHPDKKGREAITEIEMLFSNGDFSLIKAHPITGRTHQIRVHLKHLKAPVLGDSLYGSEKLNRKLAVSRHLLHAYQIKFKHPIHSQLLKVQAPLPNDLKNWIELIGKQSVMPFVYEKFLDK